MWDTERRGLSVRELAELALICALMVGGKEALRAIPNVHPVTLIIVLTVLLYGRHALYPVLGFVLLEIGLYGAGLWSVMYLYAWPLITLAAIPFRGCRSWTFWAAFSGVSGLLFGALCAIAYLFLVGPAAAFSWWVSGLPFDVVHCVSNVVLALVVLPPLYRLTSRLTGR